MSLIERIKCAAESKGHTLASVERELGFGNGTMRKWDTNSPSCDKVLKVANMLSLSLDYLLIGEERASSSFSAEAQEIASVWDKICYKNRVILKGKIFEACYENENVEKERLAKTS